MAAPLDALPDVVRRRAEALGEPGRAWLDGLDATVARLSAVWGIEVVGGPLGGTASYTVAVRRSDGSDAVLKLGLPDADRDRQVRTLLEARGRGYVEVLAHDEVSGAVLLEALGPTLDETGWPVERRLDALADVLPLAWSMPPGDRTPHDKAALLHGLVADLGSADDPVVRRALTYAERRSAAFDAEAAVVLHGDAAPPNALLVRTPRDGAPGGVVLVDPDGFLGDPAYDPGVAVRGWAPQLLDADDPGPLLRGWVRRIAARTGCDREAVWEWGFLERVSTGLYAGSFGAADVERAFLTTAALLLRGG